MQLVADRRNTCRLAATAVVTVVAALGTQAGIAASPLPEDEVRTLTVRIEVGAEGGTLAEPVALDLGLGFPLWLHPVGRGPGESPPFGAVPQQASVGGSVPAGSTAMFTFATVGPPGQDVFRTSPTLLSGVRARDIRRVGFSGGSGNWILAGYEILINDQPYAANEVRRSAGDVCKGATAQLTSVENQLQLLEREREDLDALDRAALATESDRTRRHAVQESLTAVTKERDWLRGQVEGKYCWYEEPRTAKPNQGVDAADVIATLVTRSGTPLPEENDLYLVLGGHKYALKPGCARARKDAYYEFPVDLHAGPLSAADIRGYALGVLGSTMTDAIQVERLLITVDDRGIYDSDESSVDRQALQSLRLVPPVFVDAEGRLVVHESVAGETTLWESGKVHDPVAEDGTAPPPDAGDALPREQRVAELPGANDDSASWVRGLSVPAVQAETLAPGQDPQAAGKLLQIERVAMTDGNTADAPWEVQWQTAGDDRAVDHYEVSLMEIRPDSETPLGSTLAATTVPSASRSCRLSLSRVRPDRLDFVAPRVVAVAADTKRTLHQRIGLARVVLPPSALPSGQLRLAETFTHAEFDPLVVGEGEVSGEDWRNRPGAAVWLLGQLESHNALLFDQAASAWNLAARAAPGETVKISLSASDLSGSQRVVAYLGFLGQPQRESDVAVYMLCRAFGDPRGSRPVALRPKEFSTQARLLAGGRGTPPPVVRLEQVIDPHTVAEAGAWQLQVSLRIDMHAIDPKHPPVLFGMRVVPSALESSDQAGPITKLAGPPAQIHPSHYVVDPLLSELVPLAVPGGQETTPWPQIDGSHGPITMSLPKASGTLSWNAMSITGCAQVEYEVKHSTNFTKLDGDEPERIGSGTIKTAVGTQVIDFASYGKGLGRYFVRIAAQDASGKDIALRSQPVLIHIYPSSGPPVEETKLLPFTHTNFTDFQFTAPSSWQVDEGPVHFAAGWGYKYLQWYTAEGQCAAVRLDVVAGDFGQATPIYTESMSGSPYPAGDPATDPWFHLKRFGHFPLQPVYQKILAGKPPVWQVYALRVTPLDAAGKPCAQPSTTRYMQYAPPYDPAQNYIKHVYLHGCVLHEGSLAGDMSTPQVDPAAEGIVVVPAFNCWGDNSALIISFAEEMNEASVQQAISFSPPWPNIVTKWYHDPVTKWHSIGIGHMSNLWFDTVYTITLGKQATTKSGKPILSNPMRWLFKTLPYAETPATIEKFEYPKVVVAPPGDMGINYRVKNAHGFEVRIWDAYHSEIPATLPLMEGTVTTQVYHLVPKPQQPQLCIEAVVGNALGYFKTDYPFQLKKLPEVKADLAIKDAQLTPGNVRGAPIVLAPSVIVQNLGPEPIPKEFLPMIKVVTTYEVEATPPTGTPYYPGVTREVVCTNTLADAQPASGMGPWFITPTCPELPQGVFTKWTKLYSARTEVKPAMAQYVGENLLPGWKPVVIDAKPSNNSAYYRNNPPLVLGSGPGPYEILAYHEPNFLSFAAAWESPPTVLQLDVGDVGSALNDKISSIEVGSAVTAWVFEHDFSGQMLKVPASMKTLGGMDNRISSLVITDNTVGSPWGVFVVSAGSPPVSKFFPYCITPGMPCEATVDAKGTRAPVKPFSKQGLTVHYCSYSSLGGVSGNIDKVVIPAKLDVRLFNKQANAMFSGPGTFVPPDPLVKQATVLDISLP